MKCRCGNISDDETCANCLRMEIEYKICDKCRSHYPKNDVCVCIKENIPNLYWCCSADYGKHDPQCKNYKEYIQKISSNLANNISFLDNSKIGRFGFNKCITFNDKKEICITITVYDTSNRQDEFDEQLSFRPEELIEFCREVIRISEQ